jgi:hypothetical protein
LHGNAIDAGYNNAIKSDARSSRGLWQTLDSRMKAVEAKLRKGSHADPVILMLAVSVCIFGFSFLYETDFWAENEYSWKPVVLIGVFLFLIYFYRRLFSGNLQFTLVKDDGSYLVFQNAAHVLASGWVLGTRKSVNKDDVLSVKIEYLFSGPYWRGIFWICFTMKKQNIIEYWVKDREVVEKIKAFTVTALPNADLVIGERV